MPVFGKITVVGLGLIGGSAGLAALRRGAAPEVAGVARRPETIEAAISAGAVTTGTLSLSEGVSGADFVLVAAPVGSIAGIIRECAPFLKPGAVVTDAGSVKRSIVDAVLRFIPDNIGFVGSHPVAGSEKSGIENADGNLFEGADCIITPVSGDDAGSEEVKKFWEILGMRVAFMSPEEHDSMMAFASHLPHIVSCGLASAAAGDESRPFISGGGFRDTTRIASSSPDLWRDIIFSNKDNIAAALEHYSDILKAVQSALVSGDGGYVLRFLKGARDARERLLGGRPVGRGARGRGKKIIAIDGPAGSGKSTVARMAAERLGFLYLDTGAMYRAATWKAMESGADFDDAEALAAGAERISMVFKDGRVYVDGNDATEAIRAPEVANNVYRLADIQGVRNAMVVQQRRLGGMGGIVAEGRDIGTIVFPDAEVKIYLDASAPERARRRYRELADKGAQVSLSEVERDIIKRDERDMNRKIAPLKAADDAVVLDTTDMTIEEVVTAVVDIALSRRHEK